jgi:hypothetical protein
MFTRGLNKKKVTSKDAEKTETDRRFAKQARLANQVACKKMQKPSWTS